MPPQDRERIRAEIRALIKKKCGVIDHRPDVKKPVPSTDQVLAKTGMSEAQLTRRFLEHLIEEGKNPFEDLPEHR